MSITGAARRRARRRADAGRGRGRRPVHRHVHGRRHPRRALYRRERRARARISTWPCSTRSSRCLPTRRPMLWSRARTRRGRATPTPTSCPTSRSRPPISRSSSPSATIASSPGSRRFAGILNGRATRASRRMPRVSRTAARWSAWSANAFAEKPADEWLEQLEAAGIPAGPINTISQALADVQAQHRQMVRTMAGLPVVGLARPDRRRARRRRPAAAGLGRAHK